MLYGLLYGLLLVFFELLSILVFALLEISIEGTKPWGAALPQEFGGKKAIWILTEYHVLKDLFIIILLMTGIAVSGHFHWRQVFLVPGVLVTLWVAEDFWWNILHPCWNWRLFRLTYQTKFIRRVWLGPIPADYLLGLGGVFLFHWLGGGLLLACLTVGVLVAATLILSLITSFPNRQLDPTTTRKVLIDFFVPDENGKVRQWDPPAFGLKGLPPEEVVDKALVLVCGERR